MLYSHLYLWALLIVSPSVSAATAAQSFPLKPGQCKPIPGDALWPSDSEWSAFNSTIKGRLLRPSPPAAACHPGRPEFNKEACDAVKKGFADANWHVADPLSNMFQNWNNYSCTPTVEAGCSGAGYPIFVVAAKETDDVVQTVKFARKTGVRLNIKSTGHCALGRSVQPNSLSIWTHALKHMKWFDTSFTPTGCKAAIDGISLEVGAGNQWGEIYKAGKDKDPSLTFLGGAYESVSVGGFLMNGGHGPLSAKFGLGADSVSQIELVTAEGEIITANECQNQEYFWAMRGGGGSTYGVALSFVIQAVKVASTGTYITKVQGWDELLHLHSKWPQLAAIGASGYFSGYPGAGRDIRASVRLANSTSDQLKTIMEPIMDSIRQQRLKRGASKRRQTDVESPAVFERYADHATWEAAKRHTDEFMGSKRDEKPAGSFEGMGESKILTSWLWSAEDVAKAKLREALVGAFENDTFLLTNAVMGVGTHNPPPMRGGSNAVNPAFRTAIMRPAAEVDWKGGDRAELARRSKSALKLGMSLRSLNPTGGTYANEGDPNLPDWQHAFWGSNYERLFEIKQKVDPFGVFYCRACVGSEMFEVRNGALCLL
ncbi:FAD-binding domain-containing protein [Venturia nashicola]|uniref:FAD-binding domain-containing protein n=1 Tax=Venturia nashicola TaxID=86259 RepID=A0A4Z1P235_9PEZI|nr:FAD-binding domain-containing protein [Venturia nashicola]TLD34904.1 FAD-binding domain-containing protein [Venturia nashicola]